MSNKRKKVNRPFRAFDKLKKYFRFSSESKAYGRRAVSFVVLSLIFITSCRGNKSTGGVSTDALPVLLDVDILEDFDETTEDITAAEIEITAETTTETTTESTTEATTEATETTKIVKTVNTAQFAEEITEIAQRNYVTGMSLAVFANGEIIYTQALGYASKEENIAASDDTKYRAASISKTVTALIAMMLSDEGRLDPDASATSVLGYPCEADPAKPNKIKHLMTHTSTIYDSYAYENGLLASPPNTLKMVFSNGTFRNDEPGTNYLYTNFGFGVMAAVIEKITDERFYNCADKTLFKRIGIDAGYNRSMISDTGSIANIYAGGGLSQSVRTWGRTKDYYDKYPIGQQYASAQCELIISAPDLAKIGIILAGNGTYNNVRVISEKALAEMKMPFITVESEDGYSTSYGYGLRMCDDIVDGRTITGHPGQAFGMVGGLYFDSADGTGVALLTNGCNTAMGEAGMYTINYEIVNAVYSSFFY